VKKENKRLLIILVIGLVSAILMIFFSNLTFFENLEHKLTDFKFSVRGVESERLESSKIVIVAIDDQSFAAIPHKYPWPRTYHARLVDNLARAGAKTILFDITFTEESSTDPRQDDAFRGSIARAKNVVLAGKMIIEEREGFSMVSVLPPIRKLREVAPFGLADTKFDTDGFVRRYILFRDYDGTRYFSLGIAALIKYLEAGGAASGGGSPGEPSRFFRETPGGDYILGNLYRIKKYDDLPSSLLNYYGPAYSFKTISYEQVVDEEGLKLLMERNTFKDKIVLVGATVSELHDLFSTPFYISGGEMLTPGVEIHANFIQSVLDQNFILPVGAAFVYALTFVLTLLIAFLIKKTKPFVGIVLPVALGGALFFANVYLFSRFNILMNLITPLGGVALAFMGCNAYQYFSESKEKLYIRNAFRHYLAENVVDSILKDSSALTFGGQRKHLTVLFSDIRSFTSYSERYTPEQVVTILGDYLTAMVDDILHFGGMLDKFVGDEVMAVFGAPYPMADHAEKACLTALKMIRTLDRLKEQWTHEGRETFDIGIGINTGEMIVGNLGSKQIFDYTVIGDAVNLGARLEGINKVYKTANNIIISEFTRNELSSDLICRELDLVRVKGKQRPVAIFELVGEKEVYVYSPDFLARYEEGLKTYKNRAFEKAMNLFKQCLLQQDDDISRMYMKRCRHFMKDPPGKEWDGVFTLTTK
jgi:adenylate cyclase